MGLPLTFIQISDSHMRPSGAEWHSRVARVYEAIRAREPAPRFVLHTGDLLDDPAEEAVRAFRAQFPASDLPLHVVPGNHDVWNALVTGAGAPWWTRTTTQVDEQQFRRWFGPTVYSVIYDECALVAFNSQLLNTPLPEAEAQWDWLTAELARLHAQTLSHIILFTHMPLFVRVPDENLDWSDWRNSYLVIAPPARDRLLELIRLNHVTGYLCGHWHYPLQHIVRWSEDHSTSFVICDASGPTSIMAQQQFDLPPRANRSLYCLHHVERSGMVTEFVLE